MTKNAKTPADLWLIRKQFTHQMAAVSFMTFIMCIGGRSPGKLMISRSTGNIWVNELAPGMSFCADYQPCPTRLCSTQTPKQYRSD